MDDPKVDPGTPASPEAGPSQPHGDAFLDQSGSRHGTPPPESEATEQGPGPQEEEPPKAG